ncbi:MAG: 2-succinyl-5-enolpyruvyl-6-hydroxy-3-cyclohexene-1-carboxylic-acid synthase [Gammaproteobacteria bacterium]|nr:2-succinyl-5-enolpyruvyl-6-hydroxy-3-cyclohexene-1-carboxylic-acid synthase [Gammaproteobacteria bacterium]MBU1646498.1 2-succinyl-5-enolpyruvyl-6-hydroxy-3-cyclohexene-1-carboxylic-acid synthase [Gammaproteobacteria bacterium]MBU1971041.1 2-succinyl-5-enolpyruvyl-6-hydroxy-3-cyclohexene-1-carboxylic-acid synthase [Gammaproteobacteria bacterium]
MNTGELNLSWADAFIAALAAAGLHRVVLAPGARSAPLALACLRRPELSCEVMTDERAAGYFALGLAKAECVPAAVLCTSGTAAANLLPAVMEANLAGVPLLVLTADRPPEAHGWGANQTADQLRLYGSQVRAFHAVSVPDAAVDQAYLRTLAARLVEECQGPLPGPVHANLPFREPLLPDHIPPPPPLPRPPIRTETRAGCDDVTELAAMLTGRPGVIVCGEMPGTGAQAFAAAVTALAAVLDAPILAEPLSGLRHGAHDRSRVLAHQALFLRQESLPQPEWVLRFGAFPVSRVVQRWLGKLGAARHVLVAPPGRWPDPLWHTDQWVRAEPAAFIAALSPHVSAAPAAWRAAWSRAETDAAGHAARTCAQDPWFEGTVARCLLAALPVGGNCFVGNSLAIRAVDAFGGTSARSLTLHGNRGASGIDGNVATAAGIAVASDAALAVLIGDQAALHDCGGFTALAGRDVVVVVMDNGGGGIFDHLPFAKSVPDTLLRRGWTAPPQVDFAALAATFNLRHAEADDAAGLDRALVQAFAAGGPWLLRARIDRRASQARFDMRQIRGG